MVKQSCSIVFFGWLLGLTACQALQDCPCDNKAWCQPVNATDRKEIYIFSTKDDNWNLYDWTRVTTVAHYNEKNHDLMCYAHSKGVRVVKPVDFPTANLTNPQDRTSWVQQQISILKENFLDGINLDYEDAFACSNHAIRDGLTALVKELGVAIRKSIPGGQLTFDYGYIPPSSNAVIARCFDYVEITKVLDFAFIMAYDENWGNKTAWANCPYPKTVEGIKKFLSIGIPASKLVLGIPWYGYDYPCKTMSQTNVCTLVTNTPGGTEINYSVIKSKLFPMSTSSRLWDPASKSPYFNYKLPSSDQIHQVWYDDPESLKYKYTFAQQMGLRGVGMWTADSINYTMTSEGEKERKEMWGGLPQY